MRRPIGLPRDDLAELAEVPRDQAPPGRRVRYFDDDPGAMALILAAVAGLRVQLEALCAKTRAGTEAYHALGREIGRLVVIEAQCRRALPDDAEAGAARDLARARRAGELDAIARRRRA